MFENFDRKRSLSHFGAMRARTSLSVIMPVRTRLSVLLSFLTLERIVCLHLLAQFGISLAIVQCHAGLSLQGKRHKWMLFFVWILSLTHPFLARWAFLHVNGHRKDHWGCCLQGMNLPKGNLKLITGHSPS